MIILTARPKRSIAIAILLGAAGPAAAQTVTDPALTVTPFASGFSLPTQIRFLGADDMFVTEKETGIVKRYDGGVITNVLDLPVATDSERGLLGMTLHPNFGSNGQVYLYYSNASADQGAWIDNRLERYIWNGTNLSLDGTFTPIIFGAAGDGQSGGPNHDAGPITFGPDGKLYGTTGDLNRNRAEQNNTANTTSALVGGIYRLNDDGSIPADNPFIANANSNFHRWYGYGVRNTYGIAFDPVTNRLWETENGPEVHDEINQFNGGFNGGWNKIMGPDALDPQNAPGDLVNLPGSAYSDPEFSFLNPVAVTGIEFLADSILGPGYQNAVVAGAANTGELYLFRLNGARDAFVLSGTLADLVANDAAERNMVRFGQNFGALTDLQVGPDGALYATSLGNGTIYRIVPEPSAIAVLGFSALGLRRWRAQWTRAASSPTRRLGSTRRRGSSAHRNDRRRPAAR